MNYINDCPNLYNFFMKLNEYSSPILPRYFTFYEKLFLETAIVHIIHCKNNGLNGLDDVFQDVLNLSKKSKEYQSTQKLLLNEKFNISKLSKTIKLIKDLFLYGKDDFLISLSNDEVRLILYLFVESSYVYRFDIRESLKNIRSAYKTTRDSVNITDQVLQSLG